MQRFHDPSTDPLPLRSPYHEVERARIEQATQEFLAKGGQIEEVGFQMADKYTFVIDASRTPIYSHLYEQPSAKPAAKPARPSTPDTSPEATSAAQQPQAVTTDTTQETDNERLAGLVMADAAMGHPPKRIASRLGLTEKHVRQLCREYRINFRQR